jgi:hypothetical protein
MIFLLGDVTLWFQAVLHHRHVANQSTGSPDCVYIQIKKLLS